MFREARALSIATPVATVDELLAVLRSRQDCEHLRDVFSLVPLLLSGDSLDYGPLTVRVVYDPKRGNTILLERAR